MRVFLILLGKELRQFFLSPMAYVVLLLVMLVQGVNFYAAVSVLTRAPSQMSIVTWMFGSPWFLLGYFPIFPLITMRLISEERKLGTLETLLTAPVRTAQLVLSKYGAALVFYAVLWLPALVHLGLFQWITRGGAEVPRGQVLGTAAIIGLQGCLYIALGLLASSLARNQIVAAITGLSFILLHHLLGFFALYLSSARMQGMSDFFSTFASVEHFRAFNAGIVDSRAIVYYLSLTVFFLASTHQVMEFRRWKM